MPTPANQHEALSLDDGFGDSAHSGTGLASIVARLRQFRAQAPAPFHESDFIRDSMLPEWSVLGDL